MLWGDAPTVAPTLGYENVLLQLHGDSPAYLLWGEGPTGGR
jgi:hypothetical protein